MSIKEIASLAVSVITAIALAACSTDTEADTNNGTATQATSTTEQAQDHGPVVDHITGTLDKLDAPWANITYKGENEAAVATDVWDIDINDRDASILIFRDEDARKDWETNVIWADGVAVTYDNVGISLNSKLGLEDSLALAPKLAEELGGRVTTGDTDLFRDEDDDAPTPTPPAVTAAPAPAPAASPTATCALDPIYEAGTTFYSDGTSGYTTACYDEFMTVNGAGNNTGGDPSTWDYEGPRTEGGDPAEHPQIQWSNCLAEYGLEYCQANDPSGY